jgi:tetratricopeptide (TPR) repeat protein
MTLEDQERIPEAITVLEKALEVGGPTHPLRGLFHAGLGEMLLQAGDLTGAEKQLVLSARAAQSDDGWIAITWIQFGILRQAQGRLWESESYFRKALEAARPTLLFSALEPMILINLASVFEAQGRLSAMWNVVEQVMRLTERHAARNSRIRARVLELKANYLFREGKLEEALALYQEAIRMLEAVHGQRSLQIAFVKNAIGSALCVTERCKEGLAWIEKARAEIGQFAPNHPALPMLDVNLAEAQRRNGQTERAVQTLRRSVWQLERAGDSAGPMEMALALERLAAMLRETGEDKEAKLLQKRRDVYRALVPPAATVDLSEMKRQER